MGWRRISGRAVRQGLALALAGAVMLQTAPAMAAELTPGQRMIAGVWQAEAPPGALMTVDGETPPMTPGAEAVYRQRLADRAAGETGFDTTTWCASPGTPRIMLAAHPFEIVVGEQRIAILFEWYNWFRTVDLAQERPEPVFTLKMGASSGAWDGDDLVITTIGLSDTTLLDRAGLPRSEAMTLTERVSLKSADQLSIAFTIDDPENYTRPWTAEMTYRRLPQGSLGEYACLDRIAAGEPSLLED